MRTDVPNLAVSGHQLNTDQIVAGETKSPRQPAESAPKCQARYAGIRDLSERGRQRLLLGCSVDVAAPCAARRAGRLSIRMHGYRTHGRQVDHQSAIARRVSGETVSAAAHREQQLAF